jgi:hypothetical protein
VLNTQRTNKNDILPELPNVAFNCLAFLPCIRQVLGSHIRPEVAILVNYWNVSLVFPDK